MESPKRRKPNEDAQSDGKSFGAVGAIGFQNVFLQKTLPAFSAKISVENFLTLDGILNKFFQDFILGSTKIRP